MQFSLVSIYIRHITLKRFIMRIGIILYLISFDLSQSLYRVYIESISSLIRKNDDCIFFHVYHFPTKNRLFFNFCLLINWLLYLLKRYECIYYIWNCLILSSGHEICIIIFQAIKTQIYYKCMRCLSLARFFNTTILNHLKEYVCTRKSYRKYVVIIWYILRYGT